MQNKNIIYGYLVIVLKSEKNSEHQVHYHFSTIIMVPFGNEK